MMQTKTDFRIYTETEIKDLLCQEFDRGRENGYDKGYETGFDTGYEDGYATCAKVHGIKV